MPILTSFYRSGAILWDPFQPVTPPDNVGSGLTTAGLKFFAFFFADKNGAVIRVKGIGKRIRLLSLALRGGDQQEFGVYFEWFFEGGWWRSCC